MLTIPRRFPSIIDNIAKKEISKFDLYLAKTFRITLPPWLT